MPPVTISAVAGPSPGAGMKGYDEGVMQENELSVGDSVRVLGLDDGTSWERAGGTIKALPTQGHEGEYLYSLTIP